MRVVRCGSSPHTRGLHISDRNLWFAWGIIPAHAGFTRNLTHRSPGHEDHPRTRGVYRPRGRRVPAAGGSSPHTRGLRPTSSSSPTTRRIIPAHAGFTCPSWYGSRRGGDHPRTRGVYLTQIASGSLLEGSSPHTRGLPSSSACTTSPGRIIPAHAGFTWGDLPLYGHREDHPRTRGVYSSHDSKKYSASGSSPHTRGLQGSIV